MRPRGRPFRRGVIPILIVIIMVVPMSVSLTQLPAVVVAGIGITQIAPITDLQAQAISAPGYSNGNYAYLDTFWSNGNVTPGILPNCNQDPVQLVSYTASPNSGLPLLKVQLTAVTECGTGATLKWTYGDGNQSTQTFYNSTTGYDRTYIYNHTYAYIGTFVAGVSINAGAGRFINASTPVFVSFTPSHFYSFYNESGLIGRGVNGSRYAIGLAEYCDPSMAYQTDLNTFDSQFGLPPTTLNLIGPGASSCPLAAGWGTETDLDVEWAHVAAPGAKISLCLASNNNGTGGIMACDQSFYLDRNSTKNNTMIVSNSWGFCAVGGELDPYTGQSLCANSGDRYGGNFSTYSSAGMNVFAGVGDFAPDSCVTAYYPASDPNVIAVGGTTVTSVGSSGSYGTEKAWYSNTPVGQCFLRQNGPRVDGNPGELYGANSHYNATAWQHSVLHNSIRVFPDVSMVANASTGVPIVFHGGWEVVGGTSIGGPVWAGILDVLFQAAAPNLSGFAAPFLYNSTACFHGITNHGGGVDGLGTPDVGCLSKA